MKVLPRCGPQTSSLGQKYKFMGPACTAESASLGMGPGNAFHPTPLPPPPLVHSGLRTMLKPCSHCPGSTWYLWVRDIRWPLLLLIPADQGQETEHCTVAQVDRPWAVDGSPCPSRSTLHRAAFPGLKGVALRHLPLLRMQKGAPWQTLLSPARPPASFPHLSPIWPLPHAPDRESRGGR